MKCDKKKEKKCMIIAKYNITNICAVLENIYGKNSLS